MQVKSQAIKFIITEKELKKIGEAYIFHACQSEVKKISKCPGIIG